MEITTERNKGGRPIGSKETPLRLIETELRSTVKTVQRIREMIEVQLDKVGEVLSSKDISPDLRLLCLERLSTIMQVLTKNVETLGKYSIGEANKRKQVEADSETSHAPSGNINIRQMLGTKNV